MARWVLTGSYGLFNIVLIALLWGDSWLPRAASVATLILILSGWLVSADLLFRHMHLTAREKVAGWLFVAAFLGYTILRRFSRYYLFAHSSWSLWLIWGVAGLLFALTSIGLAGLILRESTFDETATNFTVESVAPEHVLHLASTPNYSCMDSSCK
jgi:hypothetical protein